MKTVTATALAGALLLAGPLAAPAAAQTILDHADPEVVADIARGFGSVDLTTDPVGDPMILGRIDGTRYALYFYGCTDGGNCNTLLFTAYWEGAPENAMEAVNTWNSEKLFGKAYVDNDGDLGLDMALTLDGGVTRANLDDWFDWWRLILREYETEVAGR